MSRRRDEYRNGEFWLGKIKASEFWYVCWYDEAARQTRRSSLGTREYREAQDRLDAFAAEHRRFRKEPARTVTVAEILAQYAKGHVPKTADPKTEFYHLDAVVQRIGDLTLDEFRVAAQENLVDQMLDEGWAQGTAKRRFNTVRAAINWAHRREMIEWKPPFIKVADGPPRDRPMTITELRALWSVEMPDHLRTFMALSMATMGRKGTVLGLQRFQVDHERRLINLHPPGARLTKKRNPVVPMVPFVEPYLAGSASGYLVAYRGKPVADIKKSFQKAVTRAGLNDVRPHDMRATMATLLRGMGVPEMDIEGGLGHSAHTTTKAHYAKYRPEYMGVWADAVDRICKEVTGPLTLASGADPSSINPVRASSVQEGAEDLNKWRTRQDSNLWPLPSEGSALSN